MSKYTFEQLVHLTVFVNKVKKPIIENRSELIEDLADIGFSAELSEISSIFSVSTYEDGDYSPISELTIDENNEDFDRNY